MILILNIAVIRTYDSQSNTPLYASNVFYYVFTIDPFF
jgi:hypothetical protein